MKKDEIILLCAFRYAYGRRSYIVGEIKQYILEQLNTLSNEFLLLVLQEFKDFPIDKYGGDECDQNVWKHLKYKVTNELLKNERF